MLNQFTAFYTLSVKNKLGRKNLIDLSRMSVLKEHYPGYKRRGAKWKRTGIGLRFKGFDEKGRYRHIKKLA